MNAERKYPELAFLVRFDGLLPPPPQPCYERVQGVINIHTWTDRTLIAWWDNTVDKRPMSNSFLVIPNLVQSHEHFHAAFKAHFPLVYQRYPKYYFTTFFNVWPDSKEHQY